MPTLEEQIDSLRQQNSELTEKARSRKARITELETSLTDLQGKLTASETALHRVSVELPKEQLAHQVSELPDLWSFYFDKHYKLEMRDGKLTILSAATGEPVVDAKGVAVPWDAKTVGDFVCEGDSDAAKAFRKLTIGSRATGSGADGSMQSGSPMSSLPQPTKKDDPKPTQQFGLR